MFLLSPQSGACSAGLLSILLLGFDLQSEDGLSTMKYLKYYQINSKLFEIFCLARTLNMVMNLNQFLHKQAQVFIIIIV